MSSSFYAIPDHINPLIVVSGELLERKPELCGRILGSFDLGITSPGLSQRLAIEKLGKSGILPEFLGKFRTPSGSTDLIKSLHDALVNERQLAWIFSSKRKIDVVTIFRESGNQILVRKTFLKHAEPEITQGDFVCHALPETPVHEGPVLDSVLQNLAINNAWDEFTNLANKFIGEVFRKFASGDEYLDGLAIDAISRNCIYTGENDFRFFDLEYERKQGIPKSYMIYRFCIHLFGDEKYLLSASPFRSLLGMYEYFCAENDVAADAGNDILLEKNFINAMLGKHGRPDVGKRIKIISRPFPKQQKKTEKMRQTISRYKRRYYLAVILNIVLFILLSISVFLRH